MDDWRSFWDVATPDQMATAMKEVYGLSAKTACHENVMQAKRDDRQVDYQFWLAVLCSLYGEKPTLH